MASVLGDRVATAAAHDVSGLDHDGPHKQRPRWLTLALPVGAGLVARAARLAGRHRARWAAQPRRRQQRRRERRHPTSGPPTQAAPVAVQATDARLYDPEGDGQEARDIADASDGNPDTSWRTAHYRRRADSRRAQARHRHRVRLCKATTLRQIAVSTDQPGIQVQIRAGNDPTRPTRATTRWSARPDDVVHRHVLDQGGYVGPLLHRLADPARAGRPGPVPGVDLRGRLQALTRPGRPLGSAS